MSTQARLSILRLESGLTDTELAGLYGVSRHTIINWATGGRQPTKRVREFADHASVKLVAALYRGLLPLKQKRPNDPRLASMRVKLRKSFRDRP